MNSSNSYSPELEKVIQIGSTFESLRGHPGWRLLMAVFKRYEDDAVKSLMEYQGCDPNVIKAKQMAARAVLEVRRSLEIEMDSAIKAYNATKTVSEEIYE